MMLTLIEAQTISERLPMLKYVSHLAVILSLTISFGSAIWGPYTFGAHPFMTWFSLGAVAAAAFYVVDLYHNNKASILLCLALIPFGIFATIIVGVLGTISLLGEREREEMREYTIDQVIRESRSGMWD